MKTVCWIFMLVATVWTCAQSSPIHASMRRGLDADFDQSLPAKVPLVTKRALGNAAEATQVVEKDWKRPVIITVGLIGAVGTVGWNYIAAQSFISNRRKYLAAEKALEAEKAKPKPQPGDTYCTIKSYLTEEQISTRAPNSVTMPCWRLGDTSVPSLDMDDLRSYAPDRSSNTELYTSKSDTYDSSSFTEDVGSAPNDGRPGMHRRGLAEMLRPVQPYAMLTPNETPRSTYALGKVAQDLIGTSSARRPGVVKMAPDTASSRWAVVHEEEHPESWESYSFASSQKSSPPQPHSMVPPSILRMERHRASVPPEMASPALDGTQIRTASDSDNESFLSTYSSSTDLAKESAEGGVATAKPAKKIKTEDITFALTVLNAVGTLPSLILTTLNAYLYRGNPKVD